MLHHFLQNLTIQGFAENKRNNILFNFDWKFHYGEEKRAINENFDDNAWRTVNLPHDYQFEQPWDSTAIGGRGFKPLGIGWYRKTFNTMPEWKNKRIFINFEGIMLNGEIWFNGKKLGDDSYGYLGFSADITKLLHYDRPNVVVVRANTGTRSSSRWYTGGGIYRDVHLIVKDSISIARHGVYITTPSVSKSEAEVQIQVELDCPRIWRKDVTIKCDIIGPDKEKLFSCSTPAPTLTKLATPEVKLPLAKISNPKLWSCESPTLYTAHISILHNGIITDEKDEFFGIRTIEFVKGEGFKLNGKKLFLKGIACHHDMGAVGAAAFETSIARQFTQLKKFGYNMIRTSHNPYSEAFMREADKQGFIVIDEFTDKWADKSYWAGSKPFSQYWPEGITEWIKRDRNHPCVAMWSLGNELQMREDLCGYDTGDWGITTYRILDVLVKRYDATRPTTVAMFPSRANGINKHDKNYNTYLVAPELATVTDVASFNYCYDAYQEYLKHNPDLNIFQSEASTHELAAAYYGMDQKNMVGLAYWGAIEYWGESSGWPKKGWNYSFFNHTLEPYPQAYLMKACFEPTKPLIHIGVVDEMGEKLEWNDVISGRMTLSDHWNRENGSLQNLFTFTNAEEVELFVNGKSLGRQKNDTTDIHKRNMIYWKDVPYGKGGKLTAVAYNKGIAVTKHEIKTAGKAAALKVVCENKDWKGNGMDLQYVRVYAIDKSGNHTPLCSEDIKFTVSGAASLLATDNGDHYTNELATVNPKRMKNGFVMVILRADKQPGKVDLIIDSPHLKKTKLSFITK